MPSGGRRRSKSRALTGPPFAPRTSQRKKTLLFPQLRLPIWQLRCARLRPRVVGPVDFAQSIHRNVRVDLGGDDVGVAKEFLDDAQVGPAIEHMGGEGMAQRMGRDGDANAGLAGVA